MSVRPLCKELQAKAAKELNEDPKRLRDDLEHIKTWLKKAKHINARQDDQWLLSFLRGCKFSLERTKEKLETYYTLKTLLPEFYGNRDPFQPVIQEILKSGCFLPLVDTKDPDSPRAMIFRFSFDTAKVSIFDVTKVGGMIQDVMILEDDNFIVAGSSTVQDMKACTLAHLSAMSPSIAKRSMAMFQEAAPVRPKGMHFLNIPPFFETMYGMLKPFLNEKFKSRIVVHTSDNPDEIYQAIPKEILPKEYGGQGPSLAELTEHWKRKIESYRDWFLEDAKFKTDEAKRPGKPKTSDEMFGVEGSFRKLNID